MLKRSLRNKRTERGQAFVELALSLVFLLVLFTVMVDLGWAFYTMIAMRDTVQEAAVYGSMCPVNTSLIEERLRNSASQPLDMDTVSSADIDIEILNTAGSVVSYTSANIVRGNSIRVSLRYNHQIVVPFVSTFIGTTSYPLEVTVADTILKTNNNDCN